MKKQLFIAVFFGCTGLFAQQMNQSGHFIKPGDESLHYKVSISAKGSEIESGSLRLKGNSAFKIKDGFITLSGSDENASSTLRIYTNEGKETFARTFSQTINFVLSPAKNFCAFYDGKQVCLINPVNKKIKTFAGSDVFAVSDEGQVAYYDHKNYTINFKNQGVRVNEPVYRILFIKQQPLIITKNIILQLNKNFFEKVFSSSGGRIFDAATFNGKLYISVKKELPGEFIFSSFSSDDLKVFTEEEEKHYLLAHHPGKLNDNSGISNKVSTLTNELIRDPLYYYDDTVYQPIGNSYNEIQEYNFGSPYLHEGVDLLGTYLQNVYSVKKGYVKAVLTTSGQYHWRIAISNQNTASFTQGYLYAHLEDTSIPYTVGDSVNEGDVVGQLVNFPVAGFVHCHFARIADSGAVWLGDWWTFDNPLSYMTNFFDSISPQFEKTINNDEFAFRDVNGNYLSPDSLYGSVKVISKVYDQVNADWHVEINKLRYSISPLASPQTMLLDSFAYEYDFYNDGYFGGPYHIIALNTIYSRDVTCYSTADYIVRDYYHIVTNSDGNDSINGIDSLQMFNTLSLPDGSYIFRVTASDPSENTASDSMIIEIKNATTGFHDLSSGSQIKILPNPSVDGKFRIVYENPETRLQYEVYNYTGEKVISFEEYFQPVIDLSNNKSGVFIARFKAGERDVFIKLVKL